MKPPDISITTKSPAALEKLSAYSECRWKTHNLPTPVTDPRVCLGWQMPLGKGFISQDAVHKVSQLIETYF